MDVTHTTDYVVETRLTPDAAWWLADHRDSAEHARRLADQIRTAAPALDVRVLCVKTARTVIG